MKSRRKTEPIRYQKPKLTVESTSKKQMVLILHYATSSRAQRIIAFQNVSPKQIHFCCLSIQEQTPNKNIDLKWNLLKAQTMIKRSSTQLQKLSNDYKHFWFCIDGKNEASKSTCQSHRPKKQPVTTAPYTPSPTLPPTQTISHATSTPHHLIPTQKKTSPQLWIIYWQ